MTVGAKLCANLGMMGGGGMNVFETVCRFYGKMPKSNTITQRCQYRCLQRAAEIRLSDARAASGYSPDGSAGAVSMGPAT